MDVLVLVISFTRGHINLVLISSLITSSFINLHFSQFEDSEISDVIYSFNIYSEIMTSAFHKQNKMLLLSCWVFPV